MTAWEIVSDVLKLLAEKAVPGIDTLTLNNYAANRVSELGGACYNKWYKPKWAPEAFPAELCASVNDEIAHGIPNSNCILKSGDIVNFDIGVIKDGVCGDAALSVAVGEVDTMKRKLLKQAKKALYAGIAQVKPGNTVRQMVRAIEDTARYKGFVVNRTFSGHCIGKKMHEEPLIVMNQNFYVNAHDRERYEVWEKHLDVKFVPGMRLCIEPMLTEGDKYGQIQPNGWTYKTTNGKPSAMFEHMLEVTDTGCKILTTHIS